MSDLKNILSAFNERLKSFEAELNKVNKRLDKLEGNEEKQLVVSQQFEEISRQNQILARKMMDIEEEFGEELAIYNPNNIDGADFIKNYKGDSKVLQNMSKNYDKRPFKGKMPKAYRRVLKQNIIKNQMGQEGTSMFLKSSLDREVNETNNRITNTGFYQLENS